MAVRRKKINRHLSVRIDDTKWRKVEKEIKKLKGAYTAVGWHSDGKTQDGQFMAQIALIQEMGAQINVTDRMRGYLAYLGLYLKKSTTKIIIPERAAMRGWFDSNRKDIEKFVARLFNKVLDGKLKAEQALKLLGEYGEKGLKAYITKLKSPPNHPFTIQQKGSSNPLIDKGLMRNSVKHKEYYGGKKPS